MLQYLVILLDDTSVSYCHYDNPATEPRPVPLNTLLAGIRYAMKENLTVQMVYPSQALPDAYAEAIDTTDHVRIMPYDAPGVETADVVVFPSVAAYIAEGRSAPDTVLTVRASGRELMAADPAALIDPGRRINIALTDVDAFTEADLAAYRTWLSGLVEAVADACRSGLHPSINLLTDRIAFGEANSCNAGFSNITLAPDGRLYVCPAFYLSGSGDDIGTVSTGAVIRNPELYHPEYAPLCRRCDAWQCRRCVWLNRRTTLEVNTPSREQCLVAHAERNASAALVAALKPEGFFAGANIPAIDYDDPFDARDQF
jgi:CXXX repeat peptide maturase